MVDYISFIGKIILAMLLGGLIGYEREKEKKEAGLRTHILVCVGSMLFAYIGVVSYGIIDASSRILQGVITGIGFLGAGTILIAKEKIKGLTTAADIWVVAAVGIAISYGFNLIAIITTLLVLLVLWFNDYWLVKIK